MSEYGGMDESQWRELARMFVRAAKMRDLLPTDHRGDEWKKGWKTRFVDFARQAADVADELKEGQHG